MAYRGPSIECKDCTKRHLACHDTCENYQHAIKEWIEWGRTVKAAKRKDKAIRSYEVEVTIRNAKHKGR